MNFRYARHTNNLQALIDFYQDVLNFKVLGDFQNHDGYNGVFLGKQNADWHLEFTSNESRAKHHFNEDDALVFYPSSKEESGAILSRIAENAVPRIKAKNPYWSKVKAVVVKDPDGCPVIISPQKINH